ncbi:MAG: peptide ABC transporter substrate-binding protein [Alkalispirochaeta sp.]
MKHVSLFVVLLISAGLVFAGGQSEAQPEVEVAPVANEVRLPTMGGGAYMDWMKTVYDRVGPTDVVQLSISSYDKEFELHPIAAENWSISDDGLTWTFNLRENLAWSDGTPLTAHDYVFALERAVTDGYDFAWYWSWAAGIKNWGAVESGDAPLEDFGVRAVDDYTIEVETEAPKPYLPSVAAFWFPVPRHVHEEHGDEWASSIENYVSSGPYMLTEWVRGDRMVLEPNPEYNGPWPASVDKITLFPALEDPSVGFPAYLAGDIDNTPLDAGQLAYAQSRFPDQLQSSVFFGIYYLAYDYDVEPFNNEDVRKAIFYSIDRDELTNTILNNVAIPARTLYAPTFPGYSEDIAEQTGYDPERARQHLADAGYPDGEGFPDVSLWWRIEGGIHAPIVGPMAEYLQAQFQDVLNIDIEVEGKELKTWIDGLADRENNMFLSPYMYDYVDPSNFASIFVNGGRHHWENDEYTELVNRANESFDQEERLELYQEAEQILIDEAAVTYLVHPVENLMWKPYISGEAMEPNSFDLYGGSILYKWTHLSVDDE